MAAKLNREHLISLLEYNHRIARSILSTRSTKVALGESVHIQERQIEACYSTQGRLLAMQMKAEITGLDFVEDRIHGYRFARHAPSHYLGLLHSDRQTLKREKAQLCTAWVRMVQGLVMVVSRDHSEGEWGESSCAEVQAALPFYEWAALGSTEGEVVDLLLFNGFDSTADLIGFRAELPDPLPDPW